MKCGTRRDDRNAQIAQPQKDQSGLLLGVAMVRFGGGRQRRQRRLNRETFNRAPIYNSVPETTGRYCPGSHLAVSIEPL
jgi:hypothetical protein